MALPTVTVIGAGQVGATAAHLLALKGLAHVTLIDVVEGLAQGKALDLAESAPIEGFSASIKGTTDYGAMAGSRLVIATAGRARKPGMSRDDLLVANAAIIGPLAEQVRKAAPEAILIVVTNPLDIMVSLALQRSGFPRERVMGMAGVLDSARLRTFIAERLALPPAEVEATVLGSHGDLMVPIRSSIRVAGKPLGDQLSAEELERLFQRTRDGGAEVVALLKQGSAFYAPASSVVEMAEAILQDRRTVLPACVRLDGEYGLRGVCIGVPVELGAAGMRRVVEMELSADERAALSAAASKVSEGVKGLAALSGAER